MYCLTKPIDLVNLRTRTHLLFQYDSIVDIYYNNEKYKIISVLSRYITCTYKWCNIINVFKKILSIMLVLTKMLGW